MNSDLHATGESSLASALERWALRRGGSAALARALGLAAATEAEGHACVSADTLHAAGIDMSDLRAHRWVGDGSVLSPCVLSPEGDLFLWRNWRHEERIAAALHARVQNPEWVDTALVQPALDALFGGVDPQSAAGQRSAVEAAIGKRLFVLSGGPGTGKTTTVLRLLAMLQHNAIAQGRAPLSIALAAPTGKAAQRMAQALREGKAWLGGQLEGNGAGDWEAALQAIPDSTQTLHRLLGVDMRHDRFRHHADQPLAFDLVVVDEVSMVDLALMRAMLDAVAKHATLILIGDPDQLVSVSAGSVLADLVHAMRSGSAELADHHAELRHIWRAGGGLAQIYEVVRRGDAASLRQLLASTADCGLHLLDGTESLRRQVQNWLARPHWPALQQICARSDANPQSAFQALRELQLLTGLRSGPYGADAINAEIDAFWRRQHGGAEWYPGRVVLIRANDYGRRLFNGDIGLTVGSGDDLTLCFESVDERGQPAIRQMRPHELPDFELAYAMTVHKSQGSEYGHVAVLLPPDAGNRILSRQLLYTAVSRARLGVEIWSSAASLDGALQRPSLRAGGLRQRLRQQVD